MKECCLNQTVARHAFIQLELDMFYIRIKDVYRWIREMLSRLRQKITAHFQRQK